MDRLFVPLKNKAFYWFRDCGKTYEIRAYGQRWNEKHVRKGRSVELRRGYNTKDRINGKIGKVFVGTLNDIFLKINHKKIIPPAESSREAITIVKQIMKHKSKFIAFEIKNR